MSTGRLLVYGLKESSRYTLLRGPLGAWLRDEEIPATWTPRLRGWCVRTERVGDVIACAEVAGLHVQMKGRLE